MTYYTTKKIEDKVILKNNESIFFIDKQTGISKWTGDKPKIGSTVYIYTGYETPKGIEHKPFSPWGVEVTLQSTKDGFPDTQKTYIPIKVSTLDIDAYMKNIANQFENILALLKDKNQILENDEKFDATTKRQFKKFLEWVEKAANQFSDAFGFKIKSSGGGKKLDYFNAIKNAWSTLTKTLEDADKWNALENYLIPKNKDTILFKAFDLVGKADDWIEKNTLFDTKGQSVSTQKKTLTEVRKKVDKIRNSKSKVKIKSKIEVKGRDRIIEWIVDDLTKEVTINIYNRGTAPNVIQSINSIKKTRFAPVIFSLTEIGSGLWDSKDKINPEVIKQIEKIWKKQLDKGRKEYEEEKRKGDNPIVIWVTKLTVNKPGPKTTWIKSGNEIELKLAHEAFEIINEIERAEDKDNPDRGKLKGKIKSLYNRLEKINKEL